MRRVRTVLVVLAVRRRRRRARPVGRAAVPRAARRRLHRRARARRRGSPSATSHFAWNGPLRLDKVIVDRPDTGRVQVERADVRWDLAGGRDPRAHVRGFDLRGIRMQRGPLTMELSETAFDVVSWEVRDGDGAPAPAPGPVGRRVRGALAHPAPRRRTSGSPSPGSTSRPRACGGRATTSSSPARGRGASACRRPGRELTLRGDASADGRADQAAAVLRRPGGGVRRAGRRPSRVGSRSAATRSIDVRALDADLGGLVVEARGRVDGLGPDAVIEARVSAHTDLGAAFQATGHPAARSRWTWRPPTAWAPRRASWRSAARSGGRRSCCSRRSCGSSRRRAASRSCSS